MGTIPLNLFPNDELEDITAACARYRMSLDEFLIKAEQEPLGVGVASIRRQVVVLHSASGKGRRYEAGHGSHWTADFENDLADLYYTKK